MLKHFILFGSVLSVLTACGGGSGGSTTPEPTPVISSSSISSSSISSITSSSSSSSSLSSSSVSSSISSSSSSSLNPCDNASGTIFAECLNASYGYIIGSQYSPTYIEYLESTSDQQVRWSILDTGSDNNNVIDVKFTDSNRLGQITIGNPDSKPATRDLSEFQTGTLEFDLKVLDYGDAYNIQSGGVVFAARMDCTWPCSAHEAQVVIPTLDTWMHVTISVPDMIDTGLDISKVSASLVLVPRGNQANLHFQLDNIELSRGLPTGPASVFTFKEDFNSKDIPKWAFNNISGSPSTSATTSYGFGATLNLAWLATNDTLRFEKTLDKNIDIRINQASFQINCLKNSNKNFTVQMVATDSNGVTLTTKASDATLLTDDTWYEVSADIGNIFTSFGNFDPKNVTKFGIQFNYLGTNASSTTCQIDTIRIAP